MKSDSPDARAHLHCSGEADGRSEGIWSDLRRNFLAQGYTTFGVQRATVGPGLLWNVDRSARCSASWVVDPFDLASEEHSGQDVRLLAQSYSHKSSPEDSRRIRPVAGLSHSATTRDLSSPRASHGRNGLEVMHRRGVSVL